MDAQLQVDLGNDKPITSHQTVYGQLCRGLMMGRYVPGQVVSLRSIASDYGTSPMPVRAAINRLIAERALALLPNRSIIVPRLSRRSLLELTQVRHSLEGAAAALAASGKTPQLVGDLTRINADLHQAVADGDIPVALQTNARFHFRLYRASGSEIIPPLIESLWLQVGPLMHASMLEPDARWDASQHDAVLAGLQRKDVAAVKLAVEADVEDTARNLLKHGHFRS